MTNSIAMIVFSTQIVIRKYHFTLNQTRASWRNGGFESLDRTWTRRVCRTLSVQSMKLLATTRPGSRFRGLIVILSPHPVTAGRDSGPPQMQHKSPKVKCQGSSSGLPEGCVLAQSEVGISPPHPPPL